MAEHVTTPCFCQGGHETDTVRLRESLDFRTATVLRKSIAWLKASQPDAGVPDILAMLTEAYLLNCIEAWSATDAKGKSLPLTRDNIRAFLFEHDVAASLVGEAADERYSERILVPLVAPASSSSRPSPIDASTSASRSPGTKRPRPSKRSSISTIPTAATAKMTASPAGGSS